MTEAEPAHLMVFCTHPEREGAEAMAKTLVRERLAACVNIHHGVTSVYTWEGAQETAAEQLLVIKTRDTRYPALEARIRDLHPYELPEIIATPITRGLSGYLAWIDETTHD